jgi:hypothetical protein
MFVEAYSFGERIRLYPQIMSGIVIITGIVILIQHWISFESLESIRGSIMSSWYSEDASIDKSQGEGKFEDKIQRDEVKLFSFIALYTLVGFLFGLFWATPLFVLLYVMWVGMPWKHGVVLTALATAIPYLIQFYLNIDYMSGILLDIGGIL